MRTVVLTMLLSKPSLLPYPIYNKKCFLTEENRGDEQIYAFPNDDTENDRLDMQHHLFHLTFAGELFLTPIPKEKKLGRVLDIGTGTGIWAIDFAVRTSNSR